MSILRFEHPDEQGPLLLAVKAVPGARADALGGPLGDRLKIRVSAPPEGGKANKAVTKLLARKLGVKPAQVELISGPTNPEKLFRISGVALADALSALGL